MKSSNGRRFGLHIPLQYIDNKSRNRYTWVPAEAVWDVQWAQAHVTTDRPLFQLFRFAPAAESRAILAVPALQVLQFTAAAVQRRQLHLLFHGRAPDAAVDAAMAGHLQVGGEGGGGVVTLATGSRLSAGGGRRQLDTRQQRLEHHQSHQLESQIINNNAFFIPTKIIS